MFLIAKSCGLVYLKRVRDRLGQMSFFQLHRRLMAEASTNLTQPSFRLMIWQMMCGILPISRTLERGWFYQNTLQKAAQLSKPDGVVNFKAFRTGEMYLVRAEASARNGDEATALDDLNTLRAARINGYVPEVLSGAALTDAIAQERRKELICEGHRFFDLKRTTRTVNRDDCNVFARSIRLPVNGHGPYHSRKWMLTQIFFPKIRAIKNYVFHKKTTADRGGFCFIETLNEETLYCCFSLVSSSSPISGCGVP